MFGFADFWVTLAFLCMLGSVALCVVYGIANWNKGENAPEPQDAVWAEEEKKLEDEM